MDILQQLIDFAKVGQEKADNDAETKNINGLYYLGKGSAFSDIILKAELLLSQQANRDSQPALQQTHVMLSLQDFKAQRLKLGLTLREVESMTGISNAYLSQLENGKIKKPSFDVVQKLNNVYACNAT